LSLQKQAGEVDAYLASLNMEITFQPFNAAGRSRITQLINKSNQFNLTTRRYGESEIAQIEGDSNCFPLQVRLADSFGDNGMISAVICRKASFSEWAIDTWLMNCRVLGRRVESMVLAEILEHARRNEIRTLTGGYLPAGRNSLVKDHYQKLGFLGRSAAWRQIIRLLASFVFKRRLWGSLSAQQPFNERVLATILIAASYPLYL
jgi:FkbH-like protein